MSEPIRVVLYLNQFFAGKGGEEHAGLGVDVAPGPVGPGRLLEQLYGPELAVVGTVWCGDNHISEHRDEVVPVLLEHIRSFNPAVFVAGPAFLAGRYGEACAYLCAQVQKELGIPVLTGMALENQAVDTYRREIPIVRTGGSAAQMRPALERMGRLALRLGRGEDLTYTEEGYLFSRGVKRNVLDEQNAAERAVVALLAKLKGQPWETEIPTVQYDRVPPAAPAPDGPILVALLTDGGLIRKGNPERMTSGRSERWCRIEAPAEALSRAEVDINHYGYDCTYVDADPNRLVPLDILREMERAGQVRLYPYILSTAGAGTAASHAERMGREMAAELVSAGVQAAILTST